MNALFQQVVSYRNDGARIILSLCVQREWNLWWDYSTEKSWKK